LSVVGWVRFARCQLIPQYAQRSHRDRQKVGRKKKASPSDEYISSRASTQSDHDDTPESTDN
jgi:hypothetical protein